MKKADVVGLLSGLVPKDLASDLVTEFVTMRQDLAQRTLGRTAPGKFVETFVQVLEYLHAGSYSQKPDVDRVLREAESWAALDEGIRICAARVARAMYTLRSKRSIAHKGSVDPNPFDLQLLFGGGQWILSELVRQASGKTKEEAGRIVAAIQAPIGGLIDDFDGKKVVLAELAARDEVLVLMQAEYPNAVKVASLVASMSRRSPSTVRSALSGLWKARLVEKVGGGGYLITSAGLRAAGDIVSTHVK